MEHSALFSIQQTETQHNPFKKNAITVFGLRLYNSLPKYPRDIESVKTEKFKFELDKFLELIPNEPKMPNLVTASGSNSTLDQLTHLRAQGIQRSGGVPDSAMEQSQLLRNHSKYPCKYPSTQTFTINGLRTGGQFKNVNIITDRQHHTKLK